MAAGVGFISVSSVDRIGIAEASRQAMLAAIANLRVRPQHLLLDAFPLPACSLPQTPIIGGDGLSLSIAFDVSDLGARWLYYLAVFASLAIAVGGAGSLALERLLPVPRFLQS